MSAMGTSSATITAKVAVSALAAGPGPKATAKPKTTRASERERTLHHHSVLDARGAVVVVVFELDSVESHDVPAHSEERAGDAGEGRRVVGVLRIQVLPIDAGVGAPLPQVQDAHRVGGVMREALSGPPVLVADVEVLGQEVEVRVLVDEMRSHDGLADLLVAARLF